MLINLIWLLYHFGLLNKKCECSGVEWSGYPLDLQQQESTCGAINDKVDKNAQNKVTATS